MPKRRLSGTATLDQWSGRCLSNLECWIPNPAATICVGPGSGILGPIGWVPSWVPVSYTPRKLGPKFWPALGPSDRQFLGPVRARWAPVGGYFVCPRALRHAKIWNPVFWGSYIPSPTRLLIERLGFYEKSEHLSRKNLYFLMVFVGKYRMLRGFCRFCTPEAPVCFFFFLDIDFRSWDVSSKSQVILDHRSRIPNPGDCTVELQSNYWYDLMAAYSHTTLCRRWIGSALSGKQRSNINIYIYI